MLLRPLLRLIRPGGLAALPSQCHICHAWPAQPLCGRCVARFAQPVARCERCALPLTGDARICGACLKNPPPLDLCLAAVHYAWPWADRIAQFKFSAEPGLATPLAALLGAAPGVASALGAADLLIPLPLSDQRLAERGYNPAQLLAQHCTPPHVPVRLDLLLRTRDTPPQHNLPRAQRLRNVRGVYAVEPLRAADLAGRRVVLIDDVMTTGASLFEAARTVRSAGAAHITALAFGRTPPH